AASQDGSDAALRRLGMEVDLPATIGAADRRRKPRLVRIEIAADGGRQLVHAVVDPGAVIKLSQGTVEEPGEVEELATGERAETAAHEQAPPAGRGGHAGALPR